jgi:gliding motility-associated-like protein
MQYIWDFGDGITSTLKNPIHSYAGPGVFSVNLKIITGTACLDKSISKSLNLQLLDIQAPPAQTIDPGQSVQLFVTGGGTTFQWSPAQWLNDPSIKNPIAKPLQDIMYTVTVSNDAGCIDVDSVLIHIKTFNGLYVPSAFTPGNDGLNDILKPFVGVEYTLSEFSVFNRWGQKVFSTSQNGKGWDGKSNGQPQGTGVYIWLIKVTDQQKKVIEKKGTVTLIR